MSREAAKLYLYIPTRGRINMQRTLEYFSSKWLRRTTIVCPHDEVRAHEKNWKSKGVSVLAQDKKVNDIAGTRKQIFHHAHKLARQKIMMADDDLRFAVRNKNCRLFAGYGNSHREWESKYAKYFSSLRQAEIADVSTMLRAVERMLSVYAHGGLGSRMMNNIRPYEFTLNMRVMDALAFHVPTVMQHCELGRIKYREDMDYTLQLLRAGFPNAVYSWGSVDQHFGRFQNGGCSVYRTIEENNAQASVLAELHPGFVKVVDRTYKQGIDRTEVTVYWQKAAAEGQARLLIGEEEFI